jgi:hypothetical protein
MIAATLSIFSCTKDGLYDEPYFSRIDTVYIDNTVEEEEDETYYQDYHDTDFYNGDEDDIQGEPDYLEYALGEEWVLTNAMVYVENRDLYTKVVYDLFGSNRVNASMSLFDPTEVPKFDEITLYETTWEFRDERTFVIDGQHTYNMQTHYNALGQLIFRPYGFNGGTARPIVVQYVEGGMMKVITRESFNSDNTYNYKYFSELTFVKKGSGNGYDASRIEGYTYGGVWEYDYATTSNSVEQSLAGSVWVIKRYDRGVEPYYPNDTLKFISSNKYTINGSLLERSYSIYKVTNTNMSSLTLYGLNTLSGDFSGEVLTQSISDGEINNVEFSSIWNNQNKVNLWMERVN